MTAPLTLQRRRDDAALALRVVAGDHAAFEFIVRSHGQRLYRIARSVLRDSAEAEDALQEAYVRAFRAAAGFRGDANLATWLTRVVLNECLARLRQVRRRNSVASLDAETAESERLAAIATDDDLSPQALLSRLQTRLVLERRIAQLPPPFRAVFVLRTVDELSVQEVACRLGLTEATVRSRHCRARGMLRATLAGDIGVDAPGSPALAPRP
jgi:RNA polymerase sigma-70 factor, ECF subfamily